ncbi:hypothetical protein [Pseudomonas sp. DWP3-1-2]|uniref:hypothetical protein n=1 Tax=Pseudomonas sp. DWP3-1-2 TaxID=2804645 RepID=UPI003CF968EB
MAELHTGLVIIQVTFSLCCHLQKKRSRHLHIWTLSLARPLKKMARENFPEACRLTIFKK